MESFEGRFHCDFEEESLMTRKINIHTKDHLLCVHIKKKIYVAYDVIKYCKLKDSELRNSTIYNFLFQYSFYY